MQFDKEQSVIELTSRLLQINTIDPPGNESLAARLVGEYLSRASVRFETFEIAPGRECLVARIPGKGTKGPLVYSGHFDTIDVRPGQWSVDPFGGVVSEGRIYGRGAADMKSGVAAMTVAAMGLALGGHEFEGDIVFVFSAAENTTEQGAKELLARGYLDHASGLIVGEPTSDKVLVAEKGALWLRAKATGEYGHNAFSEDRTGDRGNAIVRLSEYLVKANRVALPAPPNAHLGPSTCNIGYIQGGEAFPLIAGEAYADIDIRTLPGQDVDAVVRAFREIAGPHIDVEVVDIKPPVETPDDDPLVRACLGAAKAAGISDPGPRAVGYYSDASVFVPSFAMPMIIFGPGNIGDSGAIDEYVEVSKLTTAVDAYERMASEWL